jgi:perosamine synthetase
VGGDEKARRSTVQPAIPLSGPDLTEDDIRAVADVLRSGRLSLGPALERFESRFAERTGRAHAVGVNSGTSGLHLCVRALGIGEGDEVITTPFSFVASTNCILFERARPVFVDIDPETYNLDPALIARSITPRTKAILAVEVFGNCAGFEEYERIARGHDLALIEDSCEALGGRLGGRPVGSFGDCSVFGFYPNKQITTGEGGIVVTDEPRLADLCRSMRNQGRADEGGWLDHVRLGYNYRLSEISAALGERQLARLEEIVARRRELAGLYHALLADVEDVRLPPQHDLDSASWFVYVVRLADRYDRADRQAVLSSLRRRGIGCRAYFPPIHLLPHVRAACGTGEGEFPHAERLADRTIALPFFNGLDAERVAEVVDALKAALVESR